MCSLAIEFFFIINDHLLVVLRIDCYIATLFYIHTACMIL